MKRIILASNSPRRRELLGGLDLDFEVKVLPDIDESYPDNLPAAEVQRMHAVCFSLSVVERIRLLRVFVC